MSGLFGSDSWLYIILVGFVVGLLGRFFSRAELLAKRAHLALKLRFVVSAKDHRSLPSPSYTPARRQLGRRDEGVHLACGEARPARGRAGERTRKRRLGERTAHAIPYVQSNTRHRRVKPLLFSFVGQDVRTDICSQDCWAVFRFGSQSRLFFSAHAAMSVSRRDCRVSSRLALVIQCVMRFL